MGGTVTFNTSWGHRAGSYVANISKPYHCHLLSHFKKKIAMNKAIKTLRESKHKCYIVNAFDIIIQVWEKTKSKSEFNIGCSQNITVHDQACYDDILHLAFWCLKQT